MKFFNNLSIGTKLSIAISILLIPVLLLGYFLVDEKRDLIAFAEKEVAGVHYLRAAHETLAAVTAAVPDNDAFAKAAEALKQAEKADAGTLELSQQTKELLALLEENVAGKETEDLVGKTTDLIASISDNSNITLDPDGDAYFIGDIVVNQSTGIIVQVSKLIAAAKALDANHNDETVIAYARARDASATSAGNLATDLRKAFRGNADGSLKAALEADGEALSQAMQQLQEVSATNDRLALSDVVADVRKKTEAIALKNADEMERLLQTRIDGFYDVLVIRLSIATLVSLLGIIIVASIVRFITRPIAEITKLMSRLAWGELDIVVPDSDRKDEIGKLTKALEAFHEAAVEREDARAKEVQRNEAEKKRALAIQSTTAQFEDKVAMVVNTVASAATQLSQTAQLLVQMMNKTGVTLNSATSGASETTTNVQSVASAAEEMTASIREISGQLQHSNATVQTSVRKTELIDEQAASLNTATSKVKEVISLISDIAAQINLLALNATIESARAGEAGRGFAVVASEVKNLAGQTDRSIQEIEKVIQEMDAASIGIIDSLKEIKESIRDISSASGTIAAAVEEQSATTSEIARNMQSAAQGTQQITSSLGDVAHSTKDAEASSDEVLAAAQELSRQAEGLRHDVQEFLAALRAA